MNIDITNPKLMNRQDAMKGCGMTVEIIDRMMRMTDVELDGGIKTCETALAKDQSNVRASNMLRAVRIEIDMRAKGE